MPKTFYTERDIEDLHKRGVTSLAVDDDVVLTDLAREKARRLGVELLREHDQPSSAPVRPYIAQLASPSAAASAPAPSGGAKAPAARPSAPSGEDLEARVRRAVVARLGEAVDAKLLETIIQRVLKNVGAG